MATPTTEQFAELFIRHQRRLYGFIHTVVPHAADADEIFQETSLILWKKHTSFEMGTDFNRWANAIAFNVIRNYRAARSRDRLLLSERLMSAIAARCEDRSDELDRRVSALSDCLQRLPATDRQLIKTCYADTNTISDVAEQLRQSRNALYQRLHRIRSRLVECINRTLRLEEAS